MGELLLELLSEEIPARIQEVGIGFLEGIIRQRLLAAKIPAVEPIESYVTPRRMVIVARNVPDRQPDRIEERRGPRAGAPKSAVEGFLRSSGFLSFEELSERELPSGRFYFAELKHRGLVTTEVLRELIRDAISGIPWPKSMRWPGSSLRWVRPLNSVICLFDGEVVPVPLSGVTVGRTTRGHRFLSPGEICVGNAGEYLERLQEAHVVLNQEQRREAILKQLDQVAAVEGFALKQDPGLLDEVAGLVEFPVVLAGAIDAEFMALPPEVLATAMRAHQRYFSCLQSDGRPAPCFLFVADNLAADGGKLITAGNERVLRARLADARFFWDQDRKLRMAERVETLKTRVYHEKLGSVYDKVERIGRLISIFNLAGKVGANTNLAFRAAHLCKADLSTGMVGEFPELQGIMGRYYALHDDEDRRVADAIADHYKPQGPHDGCPTAPESIAVALADKIDALAVFFAIGEKPTGSRDPFALRRAALGIIRLIIENNLRLRLSQVFQEAWVGAHIEGSDPTAELLEFIADRLKVHLREQGVRHDLIAAAFVHSTGIPEVPHFEDDLVRLIARVRALETFLATDNGANLLVAYRRATNIVAIEEKRSNQRYDDHAPDLSPGMLRLPEERALDASLRNVNTAPEILNEDLDFSAAMARLATLRRPVDEFFDKVTVNTDEPRLRENRLRLLSAIRATMNRVADFSQIEG
jgi:glycyl-tRNA synthetase beta chain